MAAGDRAALGLTAGETITGALAKLVKLGTDPSTDVIGTLVGDVDQEAQDCTLTVLEGERDATYALTVTSENNQGRRWSRLLTVLVVA